MGDQGPNKCLDTSPSYDILGKASILDGRENMGRNKKPLVTALTLASLFLFSAISVFAQPFGVGSSQAQTKPKQEILNTAGGRFVFGQISDSSKDKFMLDTVTGRLWRIAETGEAGIFLRAVPYRTTDGKLSPIPENISDTKKK
jgi:hypothetical protein